MPITERQRVAFEAQYAQTPLNEWDFERTSDVLTRYLRDRRLNIALNWLMTTVGVEIWNWKVLVVCGGPGGEGSFLLNAGFQDVTVSDFSPTAVALCAASDRRLKAIVLDAENIAMPDASYDLVLVQDGLHHLPRPVLGLTEMVRVAKRCVVVIEPHAGIVGGLLGTEWERTGNELNFVFRWNGWLFRQVIRSCNLFGGRTEALMRGIAPDPRRPYRADRKQLGEVPYVMKSFRVWDHHFGMGKLTRRAGGGNVGLLLARAIYFVLGTLFYRLGNQFIGILVKEPVERS